MVHPAFALGGRVFFGPYESSYPISKCSVIAEYYIPSAISLGVAFHNLFSVLMAQEKISIFFVVKNIAFILSPV